MAASMTKSKAFEELGLTEGASDAEIKAARNKLLKLHHPDRDKNGTEKMAVVNAAYERLTRYRNDPDPIEKATIKEEDPWADFDNWESENDSSQSQNSKIGKSLYITIDIPWEVANLGRNHIISYKVLGKAKRITVKIPKGSKSGKQIRCAGKGEPGVNGGISGDLFVTLNVINKEYVTDIVATLVLRSSEIHTPGIHYLNVIVDGVSKRISVPAPANIKDGQTIKVSGMGNKSSVSNFRGDILVKVTVIASQPGKDFETYAIVDGFLRVKMALFNGANVTLRDVKTNQVVYSSFKLEARHKDGLRYLWDGQGGVGDPGQRRGKLWVTPRYTDGARNAVGVMGVIAALFLALIVFGQINGSSSPTYDTYESSSEVMEEPSEEQPSEEETFSWLPTGFEYTDTDNSFAYAYYQPDEYNCSEDSAVTCIKLQIASEQDCSILDLQIRFYDSETGEEEWARGQFSDFIGGIPQDAELSIFTQGFDSIDSIQMYCSIP
jgi:curved DNA-binding protein CbpA